MPVPNVYRVHSREPFGPVYHVQVLNRIAVCNCPGYSMAGHCYHQQKGLEMNQEEEGTESTALVPIQVTPPAASLPTLNEINVMALIAGRAANAAGIVPKSIETPDQAFAVMLAGWEVGAKPMTAFRHIFVVNGRTEPDAQLMMGIVRAKDPTARFIFHRRTTQICEVELRRRGQSIVRIQYGLQDAKTSGQLAKGGPWHLYPADMLAWAAVKRVCRLGAPDLINAISGIDVEEASDMMPADVEIDSTEPIPVEALVENPVVQEAETAEPAAAVTAEVTPLEVCPTHGLIWVPGKYGFYHWTDEVDPKDPKKHLPCSRAKVLRTLLLEKWETKEHADAYLHNAGFDVWSKLSDEDRWAAVQGKMPAESETEEPGEEAFV